MIYVSYCSGAETQCFAPHGLKQPRFARCTEQLASMMQSEPHEIPFQWVEFVNVATWKTVRRKSRFKWCHVIYTYTYYIYIMSYIYMSYIYVTYMSCHIWLQMPLYGYWSGLRHLTGSAQPRPEKVTVQLNRSRWSPGGEPIWDG
jgi:hypothetical protein